MANINTLRNLTRKAEQALNTQPSAETSVILSHADRMLHHFSLINQTDWLIRTRLKNTEIIC